MSGNPLTQLQSLGQSVWYDNIGRDLLLSGGLKRMVDEDGVVGLTSNPSIFQKAIADSDDYDVAVRTLAEAGVGAESILDTLMLEDVGMAADLLRDTFERTESLDGWVSIEVAPSLAYDTAGTVAEAHRLRSLAERPNVLIKVPATAEGIPAIRQLISDGVSVNVTLIFSLERYRDVMAAYFAGMERLIARRAEGEDLPQPSSVRSVASFFVSRVDSLVDKLLEQAAEAAGEARSDELLGPAGRAAVANAKLAYQAFLVMFSGPRWDALSAAGALVQRPLWASTSTKNASYSDVLYVDELIGPDTVNTMPQNTLDAFRDHGTPAVTVTEGAGEARALMAALAEAGVDIDEVTRRLEVEGVKAFADAFDSLLNTMRRKQEDMVGEG
ncbi:MAG TPA: transaldolase [Thermoleophilia bacterium]|nr:transaldolase [Thermoleophilia bacterium]